LHAEHHVAARLVVVGADPHRGVGQQALEARGFRVFGLGRRERIAEIELRQVDA
jgi:hypothetical protein